MKDIVSLILLSFEYTSSSFFLASNPRLYNQELADEVNELADVVKKLTVSGRSHHSFEIFLIPWVFISESQRYMR